MKLRNRIEKKDINNLKEKMKKNLPKVVMQMNKAKLPDSIRKRAKLVLPDPQISDQEITELSNLSQGDEDEDKGIEATKMLVSMQTPSQTPVPGHTRITDRTPARPDSLLLEAQNLLNLSSQSTPLIPGENLPLHKTNMSGGKTDIKTPNPLLLQLRNTPMVETGGGVTPGGMGTPRRTPYRDQLNINTENQMQNKIKLKQERDKLKSGLTSLPDPKREIHIAMPEVPDDYDTSKEIDRGTSSMLLDEAEKEKVSLNKAKRDAQSRLRSHYFEEIFRNLIK